MACSDLHYSDDPACIEKKRFEEGLHQLYAYADSQEYKAVDAIYIVGDFCQNGSLQQMKLVKESLKKGVRKGTLVNLCLASHEYFGTGREKGARRRFDKIFAQPADTHYVINGFHFISVSTTDGCHFRDPQKEYAARELEIAHADTPKKPIFFFQHPHLKETVYGSLCWGEKELMPILVNYPQIIDFSGHSHAPINDPRSIHQEHLTSVGTGTFSYLELDEFDKIYYTFPEGYKTAAQMQIVEAYSDGSVVIKPYDVIAGRFFHDGWVVKKPWEPESFAYTWEKRYRTKDRPYFTQEARLEARQDADGLRVMFDHAKDDGDGVNDYVITIRDTEGVIQRCFSLWAPYYLSNPPGSMAYTIPSLPSGRYVISVKARGFWHNESRNELKKEIEL